MLRRASVALCCCSDRLSGRLRSCLDLRGGNSRAAVGRAGTRTQGGVELIQLVRQVPALINFGLVLCESRWLVSFLPP